MAVLRTHSYFKEETAMNPVLLIYCGEEVNRRDSPHAPLTDVNTRLQLLMMDGLDKLFDSSYKSFQLYSIVAFFMQVM